MTNTEPTERRRRGRPSRPRVVISTSFRPDQAEALRAWSAREDVPLVALIRRAVQRLLEEDGR